MKGPVSGMMHREVWLVDMDDSIAAIEHVLAERHLSWVPVRQPGGAILGVISSTDLLQFHLQGRDAQAVRAWQMCTFKPIAVDPDTDVAEVARLMLDRGIHHVVVSDRTGIVGVVSALDFVRLFVSDGAGGADGG